MATYAASATLAPALGYLQGRDVVYELEEPETHIGRAETNDICLPGSRSISAVHARIVIHASRRRTGRLVDVSLNGCFVNDHRVHNASIDLKSGDVIRFGYDTDTYRFFYPEDIPPTMMGINDPSAPRFGYPKGGDAGMTREIVPNAGSPGRVSGGTWGGASTVSSHVKRRELSPGGGAASTRRRSASAGGGDWVGESPFSPSLSPAAGGTRGGASAGAAASRRASTPTGRVSVSRLGGGGGGAGGDDAQPAPRSASRPRPATREGQSPPPWRGGSRTNDGFDVPVSVHYPAGSPDGRGAAYGGGGAAEEDDGIPDDAGDDESIPAGLPFRHDAETGQNIPVPSAVADPSTAQRLSRSLRTGSGAGGGEGGASGSADWWQQEPGLGRTGTSRPGSATGGRRADGSMDGTFAGLGSSVEVGRPGGAGGATATRYGPNAASVRDGTGNVINITAAGPVTVTTGAAAEEEAAAAAEEAAPEPDPVSSLLRAVADERDGLRASVSKMADLVQDVNKRLASTGDGSAPPSPGGQRGRPSSAGARLVTDGSVSPSGRPLAASLFPPSGGAPGNTGLGGSRAYLFPAGSGPGSGRPPIASSRPGSPSGSPRSPSAAAAALAASGFLPDAGAGGPERLTSRLGIAAPLGSSRRSGDAPVPSLDLPPPGPQGIEQLSARPGSPTRLVAPGSRPTSASGAPTGRSALNSPSGNRYPFPGRGASIEPLGATVASPRGVSDADYVAPPPPQHAQHQGNSRPPSASGYPTAHRTQQQQQPHAGGATQQHYSSAAAEPAAPITAVALDDVVPKHLQALTARLPDGPVREIALGALLQTREEAIRRMIGSADDQILKLAVAATGNTLLLPPQQAQAAQVAGEDRGSVRRGSVASRSVAGRIEDSYDDGSVAGASEAAYPGAGAGYGQHYPHHAQQQYYDEQGGYYGGGAPGYGGYYGQQQPSYPPQQPYYPAAVEGVASVPAPPYSGGDEGAWERASTAPSTSAAPAAPVSRHSKHHPEYDYFHQELPEATLAATAASAAAATLAHTTPTRPSSRAASAGGGGASATSRSRSPSLRSTVQRRVSLPGSVGSSYAAGMPASAASMASRAAAAARASTPGGGWAGSAVHPGPGGAYYAGPPSTHAAPGSMAPGGGLYPPHPLAAPPYGQPPPHPGYGGSYPPGPPQPYGYPGAPPPYGYPPQHPHPQQVYPYPPPYGHPGGYPPPPYGAPLPPQQPPGSVPGTSMRGTYSGGGGGSGSAAARRLRNSAFFSGANGGKSVLFDAGVGARSPRRRGGDDDDAAGNAGRETVARLPPVTLDDAPPPPPKDPSAARASALFAEALSEETGMMSMSARRANILLQSPGPVNGGGGGMSSGRDGRSAAPNSGGGGVAMSGPGAGAVPSRGRAPSLGQLLPPTPAVLPLLTPLASMVTRPPTSKPMTSAPFHASLLINDLAAAGHRRAAAPANGNGLRW